MPPRKKKKKAQGARSRKPAKATPAADSSPPAAASVPPSTSEKIPVGALVPQAHGGALRNGGTNRGGPGRPPEHLRSMSRELYEKWVSWALAQCQPAPACSKCKRPAFVPDANVMNQIGKTSGRFGLGHDDMVSRQAIREVLRKQIDIITNALPASDAERVLGALSNLWDTA